MLRISRPRLGDKSQLKLEGRLLADWVSEVRLAVAESNDAVHLDLSAVSSVDRAGLELLASLQAAGHRLEQCSPYLTSLLAEETA